MPTPGHEQDSYFSDTVATFGDRLEAARDAQGLSAAGLAEKLGVETSKVVAWENDADSPRANRIQMLAGLLNVPMVWLINGKGRGVAPASNDSKAPAGVQEALAEISKLKDTLAGAMGGMEQLDKRLRTIE